MKKIMSIVAILAFSVAAQAKENLIILEVNIKTPLPTGLESNIAPVPNKKLFVKSVFDHANVKPLLDATVELHKEKIEKNKKLGEAFYFEGGEVVNCSEPAIVNMQEDSDYCEFYVEKSFGWYADIDLAFQVIGYVLKTSIPKGTYVTN